MPKAKPESKWHVIIVGGRHAEFVGVVDARDAKIAERRAAQKFGITGARRRRLVAQLALQ